MNTNEVIEKIKKAIRLANRTTSEGERETAIRLARSLAEKNGLLVDEVTENLPDSSESAVIEDDGDYKTTPGSEFVLACATIKTHFGVIIMCTRRRSSPWKSRLSWIGSRLNIGIARHIYSILIRESRRAYSEAKRSAMRERGAELDRMSFMRGFFGELHFKLTEHPLRNDLEASIRNAECRLLAFSQESGKRVKMSSTRAAKARDFDAIQAGVEAGRRVNLARPCECSRESPLALGHAV